MKLYDILDEGREDFLPPQSKLAYELRQSGLNFKQIGQELEISGPRSRDLVITYNSRMNRQSELYDILPHAIVNILRGDVGIETIDELRDIANRNNLHKFPSMGPKRVAIIYQWLDDNPPV